MSEPDKELDDAVTALDRVLEELRREFRSNPEFAHRVVKALGAAVLFDRKDAVKLLNVRELFGTEDENGFRVTLEKLSLAELKAVAKANNLATAVDLKGMKSPDVIDMLHERASAKVAERRSSDED